MISWHTAAGQTGDCRSNRPVPVDRWRGEYFNNRDLAGPPGMVRDDGSGELHFDWGLQSPAPDCGLKPDRFSVRWTRRVTFGSGVFRFTLKADDGVRLSIDGSSIIDDWNDRPATTRSADITLAPGNHLIVLEYYENLGSALVDLSWHRHPCFDTVPPDRWKGEYFEGRDFSGSPVAVRDDGQGPLGFSRLALRCLQNDRHYYIRWTRRTLFNEGKNRFSVTSDGGARLFVDGKLIIDRWISTNGPVSTAEIRLAPGNHTIILEYHRQAWKSDLKLDWRWAN